ncbi:glycine cleavage system protein R [Teredinibacter sp. KSP-S5-2]|uniref:glycine cleavage system protein R n=1 Tax=Teredinibacter sp. KSP-S5-2 TaxID=3034506 RepID=UPI002934F9BF|nr:ACT domain-containing protein [Teredinibacter sp. KSP-S5-2]WNO09916.1 ACT domain-containing protein [Teredinibacter sp. KSP-S5-2]
MNTSLILTVISEDKPGVVEHIARVVNNHNGSWLESRLSQLAGKFAGVIRVQVEQEQQEPLVTALRELRSQQINIIVDSYESSNAQNSQAQKVRFHAAGPDRTGIIKEFSQAFANKGINVEELNTLLSSMPYSGAPLFEASGILALPENIDLDDLTEKLDDIADELAMDFSLEPLE